MAKKKFNISGTLNKNQTPKLAEKIPLKKTAKDIEVVKEKVEEIHKSEPKAAAAKSKSVQKAKAAKLSPTKTKAKVEVVREKLVRMTIDTPESMHKALKIKSIERGISLRDYVLKLIEKELR